MWVESTYPCYECYEDHPIEFRIRSDGRVEVHNTPLIDELYPCIAEHKRRLRQLNLKTLTPSPLIETFTSLVCASVNCLRPTNSESRLLVETDQDYGILEQIFRRAPVQAFLVLRNGAFASLVDDYIRSTIRRIHDLQLAHPAFVEGLTYSILFSMDVPEHGIFAFAFLQELFQQKTTAAATRNEFARTFRRIIDDYYRDPQRRIDSDYIYLWCQNVMPYSIEDALWTLDALIKILELKRKTPDATLDCYWALRRESVSVCHTMLTNIPDAKTAQILQEKIELLYEHEKSVFAPESKK